MIFIFVVFYFDVETLIFEFYGDIFFGQLANFAKQEE